MKTTKTPKTQKTKINKEEVERRVRLAGLTPEKVAVAVQDRGITFGYASYNRYLKSDLSEERLSEVSEIVAGMLKCRISDFTETPEESDPEAA